MRAAIHTILLGALVTAVFPAVAQDAFHDRMSAAQYRAAGLDKLAPNELAELDAWFTSELANHGRSYEVHRNAQPPMVTPRRRDADSISSTLVGTFEGLSKGREYRLANGQVWRQTDAASMSGVRGDDLEVRIRPGFMGVWWMKVGTYSTQAKVERIK